MRGSGPLFTQVPRTLVFWKTQLGLSAGWVLIDSGGLNVVLIAACWARGLFWIGVSVVLSVILTILLNLPFLFSG